VKVFGKLFSVVAGQSQRIDEHRSNGTSRRYRTRRETRELLATVSRGESNDLPRIEHGSLLRYRL
jgi:hypothetical protein